MTPEAEAAHRDSLSDLIEKVRPYTRHRAECEWEKRGDPNDPAFVAWVKEWSAAGSPCSCGLTRLLTDGAAPPEAESGTWWQDDCNCDALDSSGDGCALSRDTDAPGGLCRHCAAHVGREGRAPRKEAVSKVTPETIAAQNAWGASVPHENGLPQPMTPEAEAAHREPSVMDALDVLDTALDDTHPEGDNCDICRAADDLRAAIEREAAHRDSPLRAALVRLTEIDQRTQVGDCITLINAALAAEPIAASSRLDEELAALRAEIDAMFTTWTGTGVGLIPGTSSATSAVYRRDVLAAIDRTAERLRATPEPEG